MPRRGGRSRVKSTAHRSQPIVDLTEPNEHLADHFQSLSVTPPDSVKRRRTNKPVSTGQVSPPQVMVSPSPVMTLPPPVMPPTMGLPGREAEFEIIRDKLLDAIKCQQGCCIYISGVPGTGKTATVKYTVQALKSDSYLDFDYLEINGMKMTDPGQAYSLLWRFLANKTLSGTAALRRLNAFFSNQQSERPIVLLLDELDFLLLKKSSILYHFFEWTGMEQSKLIVVAIANTMDLPERYLPNRIASRMGSNRINFKPYMYPQLMAIINHHLAAHHRNLFHPDAIEYCARKVSSISGDARRALSLAKRAIEWVSRQPQVLGSSKLITIPIMDAAIQHTFSGNLVQVIRDLSLKQQMFLISVLLMAKVTGSSLVGFEGACDRFWQLEIVLQSGNLSPYEVLLRLYHSLEVFRLLIRQDGGRKTLIMASTMIKLAVPEEEVRLALKEIDEFKSILQNT